MGKWWRRITNLWRDDPLEQACSDLASEMGLEQRLVYKTKGRYDTSRWANPWRHNWLTPVDEPRQP